MGLQHLSLRISHNEAGRDRVIATRLNTFSLPLMIWVDDFAYKTETERSRWCFGRRCDVEACRFNTWCVFLVLNIDQISTHVQHPVTNVITTRPTSTSCRFGLPMNLWQLVCSLIRWLYLSTQYSCDDASRVTVYRSDQRKTSAYDFLTLLISAAPPALISGEKISKPMILTHWSCMPSLWNQNSPQSKYFDPVPTLPSKCGLLTIASVAKLPGCYKSRILYGYVHQHFDCASFIRQC